MISRDPMKWVWRGVTGVTLLFGWLFILWQNKFHIDPPVVVICLGFLAVVFTISNLWRVGAATVAPEDASADAWSRPLGERGELEREKRSLLKAIKEAEFDLAMGKLSKADADELIHMYRARAIEVIKELERVEGAHSGSARDQIQREVAARLSVQDKTKKRAEKKAEQRAEKKAAAAKADKAAEKPDESAQPVEQVEEPVATEASS